MSLSTPRSCAGYSTPRMPNDIFYDLDGFMEPESPELHVKADLKEQVSQDVGCDFSKSTRDDFSAIYDANDIELKTQDVLAKCRIREEELLHKIAVLEAKLTAEIQSRNQQTLLMAEYEKKAHEWLAEKNKEIEILNLEKRNLETECKSLKAQLEIVSKHLNTIEISFNDVHEKYERAKQNIHVLVKNIDILKSSLAEHRECIKQKHNQFLWLKHHATERLNHANVQLDLIERKYSLESSKLRAAVDEAELNAHSLAQQLERRNRENAELASICDDLLKRMDLPSPCSSDRISINCADAKRNDSAF